MAFQQATIPIEKKREFELLRDAIDKAYTSPRVEKFLGDMKSKGINVRQFDRVLAEKLIERVSPEVGSANELYGSLAVTDQAQLREFYLERLEKVSNELRQKFLGIYRTV
jgi:hypothetical protein